MDEMKDITGLAVINTWWPLAPGWWLIFILSSIFIVTSTIYIYRKFKYRRSWQGQAYQRLATVSTIHDLSAQLRYIAIKQHSRQNCASLHGSAWLEWLTAHDPQGFSWSQHGIGLISGAYAPPLDSEDVELPKLISAAQQWVRTC